MFILFRFFWMWIMVISLNHLYIFHWILWKYDWTFLVAGHLVISQLFQILLFPSFFANRKLFISLFHQLLVFLLIFFLLMDKLLLINIFRQKVKSFQFLQLFSLVYIQRDIFYKLLLQNLNIPHQFKRFFLYYSQKNLNLVFYDSLSSETENFRN